MKERLTEMEKSAQCTSPLFPSWPAMSLPGNFPPNFPPNPWAYSMSAKMPFSPTHMIASARFDTPRSSFSATVAAYDDDVEFDDVFSNYGSSSPLKLRREVVEDCWRKACSQSNFAVLLARKAFSEKERTTSNCTGDHRYKKKALSPNQLRATEHHQKYLYQICALLGKLQTLLLVFLRNQWSSSCLHNHPLQFQSEESPDGRCRNSHTELLRNQSVHFGSRQFLILLQHRVHISHDFCADGRRAPRSVSVF